MTGRAATTAAVGGVEIASGAPARSAAVAVDGCSTTPGVGGVAVAGTVASLGSLTHTDDLLNLVLEASGQEKEKEKDAKVHTARTMWVPPVNNLGTFGRWTFLKIGRLEPPQDQAGDSQAAGGRIGVLKCRSPWSG